MHLPAVYVFCAGNNRGNVAGVLPLPQRQQLQGVFCLSVCCVGRCLILVIVSSVDTGVVRQQRRGVWLKRPCLACSTGLCTFWACLYAVVFEQDSNFCTAVHCLFVLLSADLLMSG
jgi:hypothetical protein